MLTLIILGYLVVVLLTFTVLNIKVSHRSILTFALIGIMMTAFVVQRWKFSSPTSDKMIVKRNIVMLFSAQESKEFISKIHVQQNQMVTAGTPLYEYDTRPNQYALEQASSELAASQAKISELEASVELAAANVAAANANVAYKKSQLDSALTTQQLDPAAIAELEVEVQRENFAAAQAAVKKMEAAQKEAEFALSSAREAIKASESQVSTAKLNLEQNVVKAPADGYVMNFQAVEGTMGTALVAQQQGSFMDMTETVVAAVYPMNLVQHVKPGDAVEIAFKSLPGRLATGKVDQVLEYTGEGQLNVSGMVPVARNIGSKGMLAVRILLDDPELAKQLPLGGAGTTAIYTEFARPFHIITKISVRIKMWMNYAPF